MDPDKQIDVHEWNIIAHPFFFFALFIRGRTEAVWYHRQLISVWFSYLILCLLIAWLVGDVCLLILIFQCIFITTIRKKLMPTNLINGERRRWLGQDRYTNLLNRAMLGGPRWNDGRIAPINKPDFLGDIRSGVQNYWVLVDSGPGRAVLSQKSMAGLMMRGNHGIKIVTTTAPPYKISKTWHTGWGI